MLQSQNLIISNFLKYNYITRVEFFLNTLKSDLLNVFPLLSFVISAFRIVIITWICFSYAFFSNEHYGKGKVSFPPWHNNIPWSRWFVSVDECFVKFMSKYRNVIKWHNQLWFKVENVFRHNERNDNRLFFFFCWNSHLYVSVHPPLVIEVFYHLWFPYVFTGNWFKR